MRITKTREPRHERDRSLRPSPSAYAARKPPAARPAIPEKPSESWLDRFRALIRLRGPGSLRSDLVEELSEPAGGKTEFSPTERAMLQNILELRERRIGDVMVPRADIIAVQQNIQLGELLKVFASAGHSRLVVYDDTLDDPTGMVHIRDVVAYLTGARDRGAGREARGGKFRCRPISTPRRSISPSPCRNPTSCAASCSCRRSMPAVDLLVKMQATRIHLALVIDEYGGTDGLVSIEDIVEQIVGDIEDEHDNEAPRIEPQEDGSFIADARASFDEAREVIGPNFEIERGDGRSGYARRTFSSPWRAAFRCAAKSCKGPIITRSRSSTPIQGA